MRAFSWKVCRKEQMMLLKWKKAKAQKDGRQVDVPKLERRIKELQEKIDDL